MTKEQLDQVAVPVILLHESGILLSQIVAVLRLERNFTLQLRYVL